LFDAVITELTDLTNEAAHTASVVTSATAKFTTAINERLGDAGQSNIQSQVVRFYKPEIIKDFAKLLVRNQEQQQLQAAAVRSAIVTSLGDAPTFALFNNRIGEQTFKMSSRVRVRWTSSVRMTRLPMLTRRANAFSG
jgi:hypothetical protein